MILHIPHSSNNLSNFVEVNKKSLDYLTDTDTDILFDYENCEKIVFPYSRFVCDVERFKENEEMNLYGQGIAYTIDTFGNNIKRNISLEKTLQLYDDHHLKVTKEINKQLTLFENVIIVDCHSFGKKSDIDVCIGIDNFHTPIELLTLVNNHFVNVGYKVNLNNPYCGSFVSYHHYRKTKNVKTIMIEINKELYINNFVETQKNIKEGLDLIYEYEKEYCSRIGFFY